MSARLKSDIALIVPFSRSHYIVPPVGLGYLASSLRSVGIDRVRIIDSLRDNLDSMGLLDILREARPDVIGLQVFSSDVPVVQEVCKMVKQEFPKSTIIIGGAHVSAVGEFVLTDFPEADYGLAGEGEKGIQLLAQKLIGGNSIDLSEIPGLIWRSGLKTRHNERYVVEDLDSIGFPAWDLISPNLYPGVPQGAFYKNFPIAPIASSRGCPYKCSFCGSPVNMGNRLRLRSLPHILEEMRLLYQVYDIREFHFIDDMFNASKKRVLEFCNILKKENWDISYTFPNGLRLNTIDEEMLQAMKQTGVYAFTVGIESGSQRILDLMDKHLTLDLIREKVNLIHESGIEASGFFLIGFPGETREELAQTLSFAKSLPLKRAHFSNFLPLPGTVATERLIAAGEINAGEWQNLVYSRVPYSPKGIPKAELKAFQRRAFLEFHLRPKILWKLLSEIKSFRHFCGIMTRAVDYIF
jgi:radical SAM superfamily enzyme YgiQ (UPF0313 family)